MPSRKDVHFTLVQRLTQPVSSLKGIGPARAALLAQKGIHTVLDLLFFTPIRYEDRTRISSISEVSEGETALVKGTVISGGEERLYRRGRSLFKILLWDGEAVLELVWFQYRKPYLSTFVTPGTALFAFGQVRGRGPRRQMIHPEIRPGDREGKESTPLLGFYPVYSAVRGISAATLRSFMERALSRYLDSIIDPVPRQITEHLRFPELGTAIRDVHLPPAASSMEHLNSFHTPGHRRLLFDRFFFVMLMVAFLKRGRKEKTLPPWSIPPAFQEEVRGWLPFDLTSHQWQALQDVEADFTSGRVMNRLLLGDVGCGKTIVAALAAYLSVRNGCQAAIMAPTQVLARQHLEYFEGLPAEMGFRPVLLTGKMKGTEKTRIREGIQEGKTNLIVGTQSLLQEEVVFSNLGLVVIDEQQRFGVRERALLDRKGLLAHQLVMTATPIPRTMAITVYGDMDLSLIEEYPRHRIPVLTQLVRESEKRRVFDALRERLAVGQQAFVICPVIEGTEEGNLKDAVEMAARLRKILSPPYRVGLIHGRLAPEQREAVMEDFRSGLLDVLVGTTVIEVGVHVPRASVMIIEHPDRFGLSQLHQLRGRVGRGTAPGLCFLMASADLQEKALTRLQTLADSHDGFEIARKDLEMRGYGEFAGLRQAGIGELDISEMMRESELLLKVKEAAERLIAQDPELSWPEHGALKAFVESMVIGPSDL